MTVTLLRAALAATCLGLLAACTTTSLGDSAGTRVKQMLDRVRFLRQQAQAAQSGGDR